MNTGVHGVLKSTFCTGSTLLTFQEDRIPSKSTYLRYKKEFPTLINFSICFRLKIIQSRLPNTIISYSKEDFDNEMTICT